MRCAVFVDAGYLLAGNPASPSGFALEADYRSLVTALAAEARQQSGVDVLRVYWYEQGLAPAAYQDLVRLPDVKVRTTYGGEGAAGPLARDLLCLARNRAISEAFVMGGDSGLVRGVEEAQEHGVRVHLWSVEGVEPAGALAAEADRRWVAAREWLDQWVHRELDLTRPAQLRPTWHVIEPAVPLADPSYLARLDALTSLPSS